jgi:hypothetical protein
LLTRKEIPVLSIPNDCKNLHQLNRRHRIWELTGGWQCSIVGTCLTLQDLISLAKKLGVVVPGGFSTEYQLHGFFAHECQNEGKIAKRIQKLLDKRHSSVIKKIRPFKNTVELEDFWNSSLEMGNIPSPYWALLTHPKCNENLSEKMFADVHMLSHLVGASNRADISRLQDQETELTRLERKIDQQRKKFTTKIYSKEFKIQELKKKLLLNSQKIKPKDTNNMSENLNCEYNKIPPLQNEISRLVAELEKTWVTVREQKDQITKLNELVDTISNENDLLESTLIGPKFCEPDNRFDLNGYNFLYVGGRQHVIPRLRSLVENYNGKLIHHDGGVESSLDELASAIVKADAIYFPVGCVSHKAMYKIKRLCGQYAKPYFPLRSTGIATFFRCLNHNAIKLLANENA